RGQALFVKRNGLIRFALLHGGLALLPQPLGYRPNVCCLLSRQRHAARSQEADKQRAGTQSHGAAFEPKNRETPVPLWLSPGSKEGLTERSELKGCSDCA